MPSYLLVTPAGILLLGSDAEKRYARQLSESEAESVFASLSRGEIPNPLAEALSVVPAGEELVVFSEDVLAALKGYKLRMASAEEFRNLLSEQVVSTALGLPVGRYREALASFSAKQSKNIIKAESSKKDLLAAEGIRAIDDLDETLNVLSTRAREWYGVHFPELSSIVPDQRVYLKVVLAGIRPQLDEQALSGLKSAKSILKAAKSSMGAQWDEEAWRPLRELAQGLLQLYEVREELDDYVEKAMKEAAPNLTELVGAALGARLISLAGGLDRLAKMPSSTIQVLGAEKALFRAMKTGARPPKHGVIFQYPAVHSAPKWLRGRLARAVASKIAIAARIDVFGGGRIEPAIKSDLEAKIKKILASSPRPKREVRGHGKKHNKGIKRRK
ncbi:MAG: NOP5/NOP56 family protein [Thermoprotei archaeon]